MAVLAWHFTVGMALRDGQPLEVGRTYRLPEGRQLAMCEVGYHGSRRLMDALQYAPGSMLSRTEHGGEVIEQEDKLCSTERTALWVYDATRLLQDFAIACAERALERERASGREPDARCWEAVRIARAVLAGEMEAGAARSAAGAMWAAVNTAQSAADAVGSAVYAARSAVYAARSAAGAMWAAVNAARSTTGAVGSAVYAAWSAVYAVGSTAYAAWSAVNAAQSAADAVERDWQESWLLAELAKRTGREVR